MQEIKALGATDNVQINFAPKSSDGKVTKFETPPTLAVTSGTATVDGTTGLVVLPIDFTSDSPDVVVSATYKELTDTVTIKGGDAAVTDLGTGATVVPK